MSSTLIFPAKDIPVYHLSTVKVHLIFQDEISLADIVLWSSLFSVLSQAKYVHQYLSEKSHTMQWFEKIKNLDSVKVRSL